MTRRRRALGDVLCSGVVNTAGRRRVSMTTDTGAEKFRSLERIHLICEISGSFDSCDSCKRLVPSRLHESHESKLPFVSRIKFIRSKLSIFSAHVSGVCKPLTSVAAVWMPRCLGVVTVPVLFMPGWSLATVCNSGGRSWLSAPEMCRPQQYM